MRKPALLLLGAASLVAADYAAEGNLWWAHIQFLAGDKLEGRNVGTDGYRKAVEYVAGEFDRLGLKPAGTSGYLQQVPFEARTLITDQSSLTLVRDGAETQLAIGPDANINTRAEIAPSLEAPMVFVGHGFVIPEAHYNDLEGLDLHGKIAVYMNGGSAPGVPGPLMSHYSGAVERWNALKAAGAIGIATMGSNIPGVGNRGGAGVNGRAGGRGGPPQPSFALADPSLQETRGQQISLTLTSRGAGKLLEGTGHGFDELEKMSRANQPLPKFALKGTLRMKSAMKTERIEAPNVVGMLPGTDPKLRNQYVIMSAHLDHLGKGRAVNGDDIYNGAMDDASGVASVIEIARLMQESGAKLKRSVIFLALVAEEKGELGSRYFAGRPTVPKEAIVADINLDMFLPLYPLKVIEVQGLGESTLGDEIRKAAADLGVKVQPDQEPEQNRFIRSDQYSFIRQGIPALAFKFGYEPGSQDETTRRNWVRDVYHKPNDDLNQPVEKAAAARFNHVIADLLERVANDPARPEWNSDSFFRRFARFAM
jgi:hypothetical protein